MVSQAVKYQPHFRVTRHLLATIEEIAALRERITNATIHVTWIPRLQRDTRIRNAHASTAIEGNPLTIEEVRALEEGIDLPATADQSKREVLNYFAGLRYIEKHLGAKSVTEKSVLRLHQIVGTGVVQGTPGEYRRVTVRVGDYVPPLPRLIPALMHGLIDWWNGEASKWSPVISSAIIHYRFEEIHPFVDGNGRTGRALALWELYRRGFDTHHVFSIDEIYWENRPRYYTALRLVQRERGDLTSWLEYTAEALQLTLERVWHRMPRFQDAGNSRPLILRPKQEQLLALMRARGGLAPREIWHALAVSKQGAIDLLRPLIEAGLVKRVGTRKSGKYVIP
jgi:Fic family protein